MSAKKVEEGKRPRRRTNAVEDERKPAPALPPTKSRIRPGVIALGIALAAVCSLGTWWIVSSQSNTVDVVVSNADIPRGHEITQADLTKTIKITGGQGTGGITAAEAQTLLGEVALVDMPKGTMFTSSNVGKTLPVTAGKSLVGVALTSAQMPSKQLAAGDEVRLVDTPIAQGEPPADTPKTFTAVVFSVRTDAQNQKWIVDLVVSKDKAPDIAARAATGRVALVLDSGE